MPDNPQPLSQLINYSQVSEVVHHFYSRLLTDPQLGHFFEAIEHFEEHEQTITDFWWISMGGKLKQKPKFDMINKHLALGISENDLQTWLSIFDSSLQQLLDAQQAELWMAKAHQIASRMRDIVIEHKPIGIQIEETP